MERLDIAEPPENPKIEAAVHCARYALARELVQGKRVLDVACGEGYGSYLLKDAGAAYVAGVDISKDSVEKAKRLFEAPNLEYFASDVGDLADLFESGSFDLIVSVETIEHLENPRQFLRTLKMLAKAEGTIVLTCPNDHWYYPLEEHSNPYHLRKYTLKEFQELSESELGSNVQWSIGTSVFGFGSVPIDQADSYKTIPGTWMCYLESTGSYLVDAAKSTPVSVEESSYFIGIWNAPPQSTGMAVYPISMGQFANIAGWGSDSLQPESDGLVQRDLRQAELRLSATSAENDTVRESLLALRDDYQRLQLDCEAMKVGYDRYVRLRSLIPRSIRRLLKFAYGAIR